MQQRELTLAEVAQLRAQYQRYEHVLERGSAADFAVHLIRNDVENGWSLDALLHALAAGGCGSQSGASYHYRIEHGRLTITEWRGGVCDCRFSIKRLYELAVAEIHGQVKQLALFG